MAPLPLNQDERFVRRVESALASDLRREESNAPAVLSQAAAHLCLAAGAKRARPRLVRLFGRAAGAPIDALRDVAVAVELIHSASLLHDDVVDAGTTRRDLPTVNVRFGNSAAVLAGDLALTLAFARLAKHPYGLTAQAVGVVQEMTRAAMLEIEARARTDVTPVMWRAIAEGKTGALFGLCGHAAACVAGDTPRASRFDRAARHLGVAFQLADDLADLFDHGSDRFGDLVERNPSYPVLHACANDPALARALRRVWTRTRIDRSMVTPIGRAVLQSRAVPATVSAIASEIDAAEKALGDDRTHNDLARVLEWARTLSNVSTRGNVKPSS